MADALDFIDPPIHPSHAQTRESAVQLYATDGDLYRQEPALRALRSVRN